MSSKPTCHPEKRYAARGLCVSCYSYQRDRKMGVPLRQPARVPDCHPNRKHGARGLCKSCYRTARGEDRRAVLRVHGLTVDDYERMVAAQAGCCLICGDVPARLYVDHDHDTGAIRGLLCNLCNRAIGQLRDDPAILRRAADYIDASRVHQTMDTQHGEEAHP